MTEEKMYIGVPNPQEVRIYVLESSKAMITTLKKYEEFKKTRMEKLELITRYNQTMKQIGILASRLKKQFPEAGIRVQLMKREEKKEEPKAKPMQAAPKMPEKKPQQKTEVQRLEEELQMIERKLNSMG